MLLPMDHFYETSAFHIYWLQLVYLSEGIWLVGRISFQYALTISA